MEKERELTADLARVLVGMAKEFGLLINCRCMWPRRTNVSSVRRRIQDFAGREGLNIDDALDLVDWQHECFMMSVYLVDAWVKKKAPHWKGEAPVVMVCMMDKHSHLLRLRCNNARLARNLAREIASMSEWRVELTR